MNDSSTKADHSDSGRELIRGIYRNIRGAGCFVSKDLENILTSMVAKSVGIREARCYISTLHNECNGDSDCDMRIVEIRNYKCVCGYISKNNALQLLVSSIIIQAYNDGCSDGALKCQKESDSMLSKYWGSFE